jgi:hypothetical protein
MFQHTTLLVVAGLALAFTLKQAHGQDGASLAERRLAIQKGTTPGKVVLEAPKPPETSASGATSTSVSSAPAEPGQASPLQQTKKPGFFSGLPPPSGRPLNEARKLNASDQGIQIKGPPSAVSSAAAAPAK